MFDRDDILFYSLVTAGGVASVVGMYLLVKKYTGGGHVKFRGVSVPISSDDKLWLARMVVGEVGDNPTEEEAAAVLWSVITRWRTKPAFSDMSLTSVIRAFSQPVNPIWASPDGAGCQRSPHLCTVDRLNRRAQITNMSWSNIPDGVRNIVESFAQGRINDPIPGYNNFAAAYAISSASVASSELPPVTIGGNTFIRDPGSLQGEVTIV